MRCLLVVVSCSFGLFGCIDRVPPTLSLTGPEATVPHAGTVEIAGTVSDPSGMSSVVLLVDGEPRPLAPEAPLPTTLDTTALADGVHLVELVATDGALLKNAGRATVAFMSDNTGPDLQIADRSLSAATGAVLAVFVRASEVLVDPTVSFLDREAPLYPVSDTLYRTLLGISVKQEAGTFPLRLTARDTLGNEGTREVPVAVTATEFPRGGYVKLSKAQQANQKNETKQSYDRTKREEAWAHVEPRQLWGGAFLRPTEGPVSSPFGKYREYSSGVKSHHLGLDLSNEPGTPIYAANDGTVLISELLHIMGNHVVIHHGQGVASAYSHLESIDVPLGAAVTRGQRLGTMGSTGQSTGPHLHWEVVVHGVKIAPQQWETEAFTVPPDLTFR